MINDQELKKGNKVYFTGNGENNVVAVLELWKKECLVDYLGNELALFYNDKDFQPIPLTPDILEKCGFGYKIINDDGGLDGDSFYFIGKINFMHIDNDWYLFGWDDTFNAINYLHQLQNLYWCLVGTELTINL